MPLSLTKAFAVHADCTDIVVCAVHTCDPGRPGSPLLPFTPGLPGLPSIPFCPGGPCEPGLPWGPGGPTDCPEQSTFVQQQKK